MTFLFLVLCAAPLCAFGAATPERRAGPEPIMISVDDILERHPSDGVSALATSPDARFVYVGLRFSETADGALVVVGANAAAAAEVAASVRISQRRVAGPWTVTQIVPNQRDKVLYVSVAMEQQSDPKCTLRTYRLADDGSLDAPTPISVATCPGLVAGQRVNDLAGLALNPDALGPGRKIKPVLYTVGTKDDSHSGYMYALSAGIPQPNPIPFKLAASGGSLLFRPGAGGGGTLFVGQYLDVVEEFAVQPDGHPEARAKRRIVWGQDPLDQTADGEALTNRQSGFPQFVATDHSWFRLHRAWGNAEQISSGWLNVRTDGKEPRIYPRIPERGVAVSPQSVPPADRLLYAAMRIRSVSPKTGACVNVALQIVSFKLESFESDLGTPRAIGSPYPGVEGQLIAVSGNNQPVVLYKRIPQSQGPPSPSRSASPEIDLNCNIPIDETKSTR